MWIKNKTQQLTLQLTANVLYKEGLLSWAVVRVLPRPSSLMAPLLVLGSRMERKAELLEGCFLSWRPWWQLGSGRKGVLTELKLGIMLRSSVDVLVWLLTTGCWSRVSLVAVILGHALGGFIGANVSANRSQQWSNSRDQDASYPVSSFPGFQLLPSLTPAAVRSVVKGGLSQVLTCLIDRGVL